MKIFPAQLVRFVSREDVAVAASVLGREDQLVRLLTLRRALAWQIVVSAVPVALGIAGVVRRVETAPRVLGAAGLVVFVLAAALLVVRTRLRGRARELIASGRTPPSVRAVWAEARRLRSQRHREAVARSLERFLDDAQRWNALLRASRPSQGVRCLRHTAPELREVAHRLRAETADPRGIALATRFVTDGASSPLYGGDTERLRAELVRLAEVLGPARPESGAAPHERVAA